GVVDRVLLMVAPILIGGREAPSLLGGEGLTKLAEAWRIEQVQVDRLGPDLLIEGYLGIGGLEEG
ncbi:MAG: dihydrofolate reductase family protein, partial [Candidatus Methylomirabilales bacterium]